MEVLIKGRDYKLRNIKIAVNLVGRFADEKVEYLILEEFEGSQGKNSLLRGVYNNQGLAKLEYKRILNNIERTLPFPEIVLH